MHVYMHTLSNCCLHKCSNTVINSERYATDHLKENYFVKVQPSQE